MMKMLIVYHSMYGHTQKLAESVAKGAKEIEGTEVKITRVKETLPDEVLEKMGCLEIIKNMEKEVPEVTLDDLKDADAIVFGTPTRFGNMSAQMKTFLDSTGGLWSEGALIGKVGGVFTSTATQHGGQESTILSFNNVLLHQGMIISGLPYSYEGLSSVEKISGGSPYGASTVSGGDGKLQPTDIDLEGAKYQGKHIAKIAKKLVE
ncbi:NAD(P)H:quinone oxidoreductase [Clostridium sp. D2Q-11]|uniref:NAD(P)H dehydrogenase (quinone) n=2 Tax=Anaeromonas frigoriresistens TaxID=2683708 RepID=A0A942UWL3_9FIRM|nr:NAD(P)H:quinone oxidoreductase [Anaeromonas frigoriresistens]